MSCRHRRRRRRRRRVRVTLPFHTLTHTQLQPPACMCVCVCVLRWFYTFLRIFYLCALLNFNCCEMHKKSKRERAREQQQERESGREKRPWQSLLERESATLAGGQSKQIWNSANASVWMSKWKMYSKTNFELQIDDGRLRLPTADCDCDCVWWRHRKDAARTTEAETEQQQQNFARVLHLNYGQPVPLDAAAWLCMPMSWCACLCVCVCVCLCTWNSWLLFWPDPGAQQCRAKRERAVPSSVKIFFCTLIFNLNSLCWTAQSLLNMKWTDKMAGRECDK